MENDLPGSKELLRLTRSSGRPCLVGITGPPGAGKSTLVNSLISHWLKLQKKVAVIAVDPSSPFNFGALLGDRIRMRDYYCEPNVFIRSLASRGSLGGLSSKILEITDLVRSADFDYILVETVGVGQSEVEIAGLADCTVVVLVPEAGDEIQTLKSGVMEIADIFVVNKADRPGADFFVRNLQFTIHGKSGPQATIPVLKTVASEYIGVAELAGMIDNRLKDSTKTADKVQLLFERCQHLISNRLLERLDMENIKAQMLEQSLASDFNLHLFIDQQLAQKCG